MKAVELPSFMVPHGTQPNISPAELEEVSRGFDALIDDAFLQFVGSVAHFDYPSEVPKNVLCLTQPPKPSTIYRDKRYWSMYIEAKTETDPPGYILRSIYLPSDIWTKKISLTRMDKSIRTAIGWGAVRDSYVFSLCEDDRLYRHDRGDQHAKLMQERALGFREVDSLDMGPEDTLESMHQVASELIEENANRRLEQQFRLQDQPIGLTELKGLRDMVFHSSVVAEKIEGFPS